MMGLFDFLGYAGSIPVSTVPTEESIRNKYKKQEDAYTDISNRLTAAESLRNSIKEEHDSLLAKQDYPESRLFEVYDTPEKIFLAHRYHEHGTDTMDRKGRRDKPAADISVLYAYKLFKEKNLPFFVDPKDEKDFLSAPFKSRYLYNKKLTEEANKAVVDLNKNQRKAQQWLESVARGEVQLPDEEHARQRRKEHRKLLSYRSKRKDELQAQLDEQQKLVASLGAEKYDLQRSLVPIMAAKAKELSDRIVAADNYKKEVSKNIYNNAGLASFFLDKTDPEGIDSYNKHLNGQLISTFIKPLSKVIIEEGRDADIISDKEAKELSSKDGAELAKALSEKLNEGIGLYDETGYAGGIGTIKSKLRDSISGKLSPAQLERLDGLLDSLDKDNKFLDAAPNAKKLAGQFKLGQRFAKFKLQNKIYNDLLNERQLEDKTLTDKLKVRAPGYLISGLGGAGIGALIDKKQRLRGAAIGLGTGLLANFLRRKLWYGKNINW